MNKFSFGSYTSSGEVVYSADKGYSNPTDENGTRRQLSFPLGELRTFINKTVPIKGDYAVQLKVTDNGLQYSLNGTTWTDVVLKNDAFSFVGMVVSGTNLATESDVQEIYGSDTSWTLLSSVLLASEHIYGNGKTLGLISSSNRRKGLRINTNPSRLAHGEAVYGVDVGETTGGIGDAGTSSDGAGVGVVTKAIIEAHEGDSADNTGLIADTVTVYTWERTE